MTETKPTVIEALLAVKADVGAIGKDRRNEQQGFAFRGIDDVMNALHEPLIKHGVLIWPSKVLERIAETRTTRNGGGMNVINLHVEITARGPAGDEIVMQAWGEAQDSADKSTGKAHSAAYKVALLEALSIPTQDMADADATTVDAAPHNAADPLAIARAEVVKVGAAKGWDVVKLEEQYRLWSEGRDIREGSLEDVAAFTAYVRKQKAGEAA